MNQEQAQEWFNRYDDSELKILQVKDFVQYWEQIGTEQEELFEEIADAVYDHLRKALRQMEFYYYEMKKMYPLNAETAFPGLDDDLPPHSEEI